MHIILARLIWRDGELQTAIAQHMLPGGVWSDSISGDGLTCASIVPGEISEPVVAAIIADRDVLDYLYIEDEESPISPAVAEKVARSALRHDIPADAMPAVDPVAADVAEAVRRRMLLSQVIADGDFETAERVEKKTIERLRETGFDVTTVDPGDDPKTRMAKAQKKADQGV